MRRLASLLAFAVLLSLPAAAPARAEDPAQRIEEAEELHLEEAVGHEEHAHGPDWWLLGFQVLNTAILAFILVRVAGPAIRQFLVDRAHSIAGRIQDAEGRLGEARDELSRVQERLGRIEQESEQIVQDAAEQAESERRRSLERADRSAQRIKEEAQRVADQEIERARQELREEAAQLAVTLAADLLRENLRDEDDRRLVREYSESVGDST